MSESLFQSSLSLLSNHAIKDNMVKDSRLSVRRAVDSDRQKLANLIHFEAHVHRHLDWRPPLDWLGEEPYLVAEEGENLVAALACPPDPPNVAWIRLFAVSSDVSIELAWHALWLEALGYLENMSQLQQVAAIPLYGWLKSLLLASGFVETHKVVMMRWDRGWLPPEREKPVGMIRPMTLDDMPEVERIDRNAFVPEWRNTRHCLELAFRQAAVATVFEQNGRLLGYQISTPTHMGGHLARLAVHPDGQHQGIGFALVRDMLSQFERRGAQRVTVNTQHNNYVSLGLYEKAGFEFTGEAYPVLEYSFAQERDIGSF